MGIANLKAVLQKMRRETQVPLKAHEASLSENKSDLIQTSQTMAQLIPSQRTPDLHWQKVSHLIQHVEESFLLGAKPDAILSAIESFAHGCGRWLKVAGGPKAQILDTVIDRWQGHAALVCVELGTF